MIDDLLLELSRLDNVDAICLGGSRANNVYDTKSDYDIYVYINSDIDDDIRANILSKYCSYQEIGNHYWELEDNAILNEDIPIDIIYRKISDFDLTLDHVVNRHNSYNGFKTCMWHNLISSMIIYDPYGKIRQLKDKYDIEYSDELKNNIIERNYHLLTGKLPSYDVQISKAISRNDRVNLISRCNAFMESYFDIIFAMNKIKHPGEKRLVEFALNNCLKLPDDFKKNIDKLYDDLLTNTVDVNKDVEVIINNLRKCLNISKD